MIYVDEAIYPFRGRMWCHLFTDDADVEKLHRFAQAIGLKRAWFQDRPGFPHYDLSLSRRMMAVRNGAKEVTAEQMVAIVQAARDAAAKEGANGQNH